MGEMNTGNLSAYDYCNNQIITITDCTSGGTDTIFINPAPSNINSPQEEEKSKMRGLYKVLFVDPVAEDVVTETGYFVAKNDENAMMKAVKMAAASLTKDIDDYDIILDRLGDVRPKTDVQRVKIEEAD